MAGFPFCAAARGRDDWPERGVPTPPSSPPANWVGSSWGASWILRATRDEMRVLLIDHPPVEGGGNIRNLRDHRALAEIVHAEGAELVLHGHSHSISRKCLAGPHGPIPVLGICSASSIGRNPRRRAAYYLIDIDPSTRKMMLAVRQLDQNGLFHQVAAAAASCVRLKLIFVCDVSPQTGRGVRNRHCQPRRAAIGTGCIGPVRQVFAGRRAPDFARRPPSLARIHARRGCAGRRFVPP